MVEEIWQDVTKRRRNRYSDMFNRAHGIPEMTQEERERVNNRWENNEPVPTDEDRDTVAAFKNWDLWEKYTKTEDKWDWNLNDGEGGWKVVESDDYRLKDPAQQPAYDAAKAKIDAWEGRDNWVKTRLPPREYNAQIERLMQNGVRNVWIRPYSEGDFYAMETVLPDDFPHMNNEVGKRLKQYSTPYHISLSNPGHLDEMNKKYPGYKEEFERDVKQFYDDYFKPYESETGKWFYEDETGDKRRWLKLTHDWREMHFPERVTVSSGSNVVFGDLRNDFVKRAKELHTRGSGKEDLHISID
jgi:hypothetical protein